MPEDIIGAKTSEGVENLLVEEVIDYVKSTANYICGELGLAKMYECSPPQWMISIALALKSNFFEKKVTDYSKTSTQMGQFKIDFDLLDKEGNN
jgi:ribonucleotide reductase beta subunit family protein with ferritin-like domain